MEIGRLLRKLGEVQATDNGGFDVGVAKRYNMGDILVVKPMGLASELDVGCQENKRI